MMLVFAEVVDGLPLVFEAWETLVGSLMCTIFRVVGAGKLLVEGLTGWSLSRANVLNAYAWHEYAALQTAE